MADWSTIDGCEIAEKPTTADVEQAIVAIFTSAGRPDSHGHRFYREILEREKPEQKPRIVAVAGQSSTNRWEYAYHTFACYCARKYLSLSDDDRTFIVAAREDGVYWRGEDMAHFAKVYEQTMDCRDLGIAEYRKKVLPQIKDAIRRMV